MGSGGSSSENTETREPTADELTLATIRRWAERSMIVTTEAQRGTASGGFRQAVFDVLDILEKHGAPADEAVHFRSVFDA